MERTSFIPRGETEGVIPSSLDGSEIGSVDQHREEVTAASARIKNLDETLKTSRSERTFSQAVEELNHLLMNENPARLTPKYLRTNFKSYANFFERYARTQDGRHVDWDLIVGQLDPVLRTKWKERYSPRKRQPPVREYENEAEVNQVMEPYRDKFYTIVSSETKEDRIAKSSILNSLVMLAQKGNMTARTKVFEYVQFSIDQWIKKGKLAKVLENHSEEVNAKISNCIDLYEISKGAFLSYVYATLHASANAFNEITVPYLENSRVRGRDPMLPHNTEFYDEPTDDY